MNKKRFSSCSKPHGLLCGFYAGISLIIVLGCGVRGRPLPPEKPAQIGRGEPSYHRATEGIVIPSKDLKQKDKKNKNLEEEAE